MLRLAGTVTKEVPTSVNWMVQYQVEYHSTKNWWFIWDWYQIPVIEKFQSSTSTVRPIWGWLLGDLYQASFQWRRHVGSRSNLSEIPIILYYNHIILYIIQKTSVKSCNGYVLLAPSHTTIKLMLKSLYKSPPPVAGPAPLRENWPSWVEKLGERINDHEIMRWLW